MRRIALPFAGMSVILALALPAVGPASASRPMSGSCAAVPVVVPSPDPAALFRVQITGSCRFTHLGLAGLAAVEDVFAGPTGLFLAGAGSYTAADGSRLDTTFTGPVQQTGPTTVTFSGTETDVGGSGRLRRREREPSLRGRGDYRAARTARRRLVHGRRLDHLLN